MNLDETKRRIHFLISQFQSSSWSGAEEALIELFTDLQRENENLSQSTPRNHEISALIQEMRNGFALMEQKFEQVDKRFEQVDKRFEQVDKRFDDLIHQMDKRFSFLQWFFGIALSIIGLFQAAILVLAIKGEI